jgi:hypothetical protein
MSERLKTETECVCVNCDKRFTAKRYSLGKFCSMDCTYKHQRSEKLNGRTSYFNCCKCHASLGFGITKSSQFVHKEKSNIAKAINIAGVTRYQPEGGSWQVSAAILRRKEKAWQDAWMDEYNPKFPDWSSLWTAAQKFSNIEKNKKRCRDYQKRRHSESVKGSVFRLKKIIRCRIYNSIKRSTGVKPRIKKRTTEMLGCSIQEMKNHLQKQFKRGMTWENHGTHWHVDHIIPLSQFDFANPIQFSLATHYTNLQPMWAEENLSKSNNITQTHQLRFA